MKSKNTPATDQAKCLHEETLSTTLQYSGRLFTAESLSVKLSDDTVANREIIRHPGGAAVVALTDDDCVLLVSQFRVAVDDVLTELPAGKLEPGEDPLVCARRELSEETGYEAASWQTLGRFYPSPGYLDETLYLFLATDLTHGTPHPDQGEHVVAWKRPFDQLMEAVDKHEIRDAKTLLGLLLTDRIRRVDQGRG